MMARNLYRFYLYSVYIALLIFAAFAIGNLLNTLLTFTPLRGSYSGGVSSATNVVQSVVFAVVALVIAGALAGLHYWLMRRDMRNDPAAGNSAVRSFFLNMTEAVGVALVIPAMGFFVLNMLAQPYGANVVGGVSLALPTLLLVLLLELERRRVPVGQGLALTFQRLHFYGLQLLSLVFLTFSWAGAIRPLIDMLFFGGRGMLEGCSGGDCSSQNIVFLLLSLLWFTAFWVGYGWFVRNDQAPLLRLIVHFLSFAYGVGYVLIGGLYQAFLLFFLFLFNVPVALKDVVGPYPAHDFFSWLTFGILVTVVYYVWLRMAARQGLMDRKVLALTEYAIGAILGAGVFWWGCGNILYTALQVWVPVPEAPSVQDWASALAFVLAGVGYIALAFYLRQQHVSDPIATAGPRRGFVLALSGVGVLALAIGGAVALYAWMTSLLGSPVANWQQIAHIGLASFLIGALLVGIYLTIALREHLLSGSLRSSTQTASPTGAEPGMEPLQTLYEREPAPSATLPLALANVYGGGLVLPEKQEHERPYVIANFVETLDGAVSYNAHGQTGAGAVGGEKVQDKMVMGLLRAYADAVIFGGSSQLKDANQVRTPSFISPAFAHEYDTLRTRLGRKDHFPISVVMTASGHINPLDKMFETPDLKVVIVTTAQGATRLSDLTLPAGTDVRILAAVGDDAEHEEVSVKEVLALLAREYGVRVVLYEGGPTLFASFLAEHLVDELFLTFAPHIAGRGTDHSRLSLVEGHAFTPTDSPAAILLSVKRADHHLLLRYGFSVAGNR